VNPEQWVPFLHEFGIIIAALAAAIAAVSSLRNGRTLNQDVRAGIAKRSRKARKKKTLSAAKKGDWYKTPDV